MAGAERADLAGAATEKELVEVRLADEGVALVTMADSKHRNTFRPEFLAAMTRALEEARALDPRVLVLRGTPEVFCAGASRQNLLDLCAGTPSTAAMRLPELLLDLPWPVVAAIEGHAVGGGLVLASCCDILVLARESRYGATFVSLGLTPGMGCTGLLPELVGPFVAAEMMLTGATFRGSELERRATNVNHVVPRAEVMPRALALAREIASRGKEPLQLLKRALAARKKVLLAEARPREELMHRVVLAAPGTRRAIEEGYLE